MLQAHHLQPRVAAARSELRLDFYSYIYISRPIDLTTKIYRDNILLVWLCSLIFEVVLVRPRVREVVVFARGWGTVTNGLLEGRNSTLSSYLTFYEL